MFPSSPEFKYLRV